MSEQETKKIAVLEINDKQFIVSENDIFKIDSITDDPSVKVLLYSDGKTTEVGQPVLEGYGAKIEILDAYKDSKVTVRRYKSKSRYRKNKSHRQPVTDIKIIDFGKTIKNEIVTKTAEEPKSKQKKVKNTKAKSTDSDQKGEEK